MNRLVTTRELCESLKVTRQAVYKWRLAGCPTIINSGRFIRYDLNEVLYWLKNR